MRTPNTRAALEALRDAGYLDDESYRSFDAGERLLRAVLLATRLTTLRGALVPSSRSAITVARRLGYRDRAASTALEALLGDVRVAREAVRKAFQRVMSGLEADRGA